MYTKWIEILTECKLFMGIESKHLNTMLQCLRPNVRPYSKNEVIAIAQDPFTELGIVLEGSVSVAKESVAGNRIIIAVFESGDMFGEMAAFSGEAKWPSTVLAHSDCTIMFLSPEKIVGKCENLCISHNLLIVNMLRILSDRAMMLNRRVEYLAIKTIRGKISIYLLEQYRRSGNTTFMLPLKRKELAEFLNVSRPSLSREMCQMRDEGIIDFHMSSVRLVDMEVLEEIAEEAGL